METKDEEEVTESALKEPSVELSNSTSREMDMASLSRAPSQDCSRHKQVVAKSGLSILREEEVPLWDALIEASPQCSVFCKSWWLKAACSDIRVLGLFEAGLLIAGIPLHYERRMGLKMCRMPSLTQTMGVVIAPLAGKRVTVQTRETEILGLFADRLVHEPIFIQAFHPSSQNWLPFYWRGFTQTTHYTYVLDELESLDRVWDGLLAHQRTNIRRARKLGLVARECDPETVFAASNATFARQGRKTPYSLEYLTRLYKAARENNAGVCMAVHDGQGKVHAAAFFVWDGKRGYQIAGGHEPALGSSGGAVLLVWTLIEFAASRTAIFDLEGSMTKPVEHSFRAFGAKRVPYNRIVKMPNLLRAALCAIGKVRI
jgi:hypothetical protein